MPPVDLPGGLAGAGTATGSDVARVAGPRSPVELLLGIHAALSTLIAPATALSLEVSEPPPGKHRILGGTPPLVKWAVALAPVFALIFVLSSSKVANTSKTRATPTPTPTPKPQPDTAKAAPTITPLPPAIIKKVPPAELPAAPPQTPSPSR